METAPLPVMVFHNQVTMNKNNISSTNVLSCWAIPITQNGINLFDREFAPTSLG